jgi:hypothetical protein
MDESFFRRPTGSRSHARTTCSRRRASPRGAKAIPLDVDALRCAPRRKPRVSVISLTRTDDAQRMFS